MARDSSESVEPAHGGSSPRHFAVPAGLFAFAIFLRALQFQRVFLDEHVRFSDPDAYYHMRRIVYAVYNFPATLDFDRYINFPHGARAIWTPMFDWCVAVLLWPFHDILSLEQLEVLAAWIPPLIGACTVLALYYTARHFFCERIAVGAGLILCVLNGHIVYSTIGLLDHHVAVAFATTLLLATSMAFLHRASQDESRPRDVLWSAILTGLALGATLLLWPGCLIHVGIVEIAFLTFLLTRQDREAAIPFALRLAVVHGVAFTLTAPAGFGNRWEQWSDFSPTVLSNFQPWFFGSATLFSLGCAALWQRIPGTATSLARRCGSALALGAFLLAASGWLWPELLDGAGEAWAWFSKTDDFQGLVAESTPLFQAGGEFSTFYATLRLSRFFLLVPLAVLFIGAQTLRAPRSTPVLLFLWWTSILCLATVFQRRFFNSSSVAIALLFALTFSEAYRHFPDKLRSHALWDNLLRGGLALFSLWLLAPTLVVPVGQVRDMIEHPESLVLPPIARRAYERFEVSHWIRINTPVTRGRLDNTIEPEYGVMAPWGMGHDIEYVGQRPTVTNNFGDDLGPDNFLLARKFYLGSEESGNEILDALKVRYVIAQRLSAFLGDEPDEASMHHALHTRDGSASETGHPALRHYRLLHESELGSDKQGNHSFLKVFEYVPGARIQGRATPGAEIHARVGVITNTKRRFAYRTRTTAGQNGRYELRVPYATSGTGPPPSVGPSYIIECQGQKTRVAVPEQAVLSAEIVTAPALCTGAS